MLQIETAVGIFLLIWEDLKVNYLYTQDWWSFSIYISQDKFHPWDAIRDEFCSLSFSAHDLHWVNVGKWLEYISVGFCFLVSKNYIGIVLFCRYLRNFKNLFTKHIEPIQQHTWFLYIVLITVNHSSVNNSNLKSEAIKHISTNNRRTGK